jgi:hypothetical protein
MKHLLVFMFLVAFIGSEAACGDRTIAIIKLANGSEVRGKIVSKDNENLRLEIKGTTLTIPLNLVASQIDSIPDPEQFDYPVQLPSGVKKWHVPVYWLNDQLFYHQMRGIDVFEIAVDFESQKLYLRGYGPTQTQTIPDSAMMMIRSEGSDDGYYERIPPD